jgi:hypothetical protein
MIENIDSYRKLWEENVLRTEEEEEEDDDEDDDDGSR